MTEPDENSQIKFLIESAIELQMASGNSRDDALLTLITYLRKLRNNRDHDFFIRA